jgi:hypothetical protein
MPQIARPHPWQDTNPDDGGEDAIPRHDPHIGPPHAVDGETLSEQSYSLDEDDNPYAGADAMQVFFAMADRVERIRDSLQELANRESVGNVFTVPAAGFGNAGGFLTLSFDPIPYGWCWAVDRLAVVAPANAVIAIYDSIVIPMAFRGRMTVDANGFGIDVYTQPLILTSGEFLTLQCSGLGAAGAQVVANVQVRQFTR